MHSSVSRIGGFASFWPECCQEKDIRFMAATGERREVQSIPEAREGRGSEHSVFDHTAGRSGLGGRFLPGILIFRTRLLSTVQLENRIDADLPDTPLEIGVLGG